MREKAFFKLCVTCGGTVNYYKSVYHFIPTLPVGKSKTLSTECDVYLFLAKLKGRKKLFLEGERRGTTLRDCPQELLVIERDEIVSPFVKFEIILPLRVFY